MKRKKRRSKKLIEENETPISVNINKKENSILESLKSISYGIFAITVVMSIFTGFKYPWKWIDAIYETENEKLEIIESSWDAAYTPLIKWCAENTANTKSLAIIGKEKFAYKDYIISLIGDERKCLEDKVFRIYLFNNPKIKVSENKSLNKWFNEIPKHVKKFNLEIEDSSKYKIEEFIIKTNLFYYWNNTVSLKDEDFRIRDVRNQVLCGYKENIGLENDKCWSRSYYLSDESESGRNEIEYLFSLNFLSKEDFILLSKGCYLGCEAKITFMKDLKKYNIRGIQIEKPILRTWTLYNDKSGSRVKDYDSMIIKAEYLTQELEKKHPKPNWYSSISIQ
tara:strand:+ start:307 stop:1320 length:1014 start_codon:yes stop_codon:yes gene_type:complete